MKTIEQIEHFQNDLTNLLNRYVDEYDLPLAAIIGTMQIVTHQLLNLHDEEE